MNNSILSIMEKNQHSRILVRIQNMLEVEFTKDVLIPLFENMSYQVEYYGGAYEQGKDLICWRTDEFDDKELTLIQVKKVKASAAARSDRSFSEIVTQLQQAKESTVGLADGTKRSPSFIFFITPYEINTRALETRFQSVAGLRTDGIKIYDGAKIVTQIIKRLPQLALILAGPDFAVHKSLKSNFSNADLLSALNYTKERDISDFYCDLDFGVGKITTKFFFNLEFAPKDFSLKISPEKWKTFQIAAKVANDLLKIEFISPTFSETQMNFDIERKKFRSKENQNLKKLADKTLSVISTNTQNLLHEVNEILINNDGIKTVWDIKSLNAPKISTPIEKISIATVIPQLVTFQNILKKESKQVSSNFSEFKTGLLSLSYLEEQIKSGLNNPSIKATEKNHILSLFSLFNEIIREFKNLDVLHRKIVPEPFYECHISGRALATALRAEQIWMKKNIHELTKVNLTREQIYLFFTRCNQLFEGLDTILGDSIFIEAIGGSTRQKYALENASPRIKMPLREVFNSGINCAVFGEAGAGKSTTLRMYAEDISKSEKEDCLTLFLPLTRLLGNSSFSNKTENLSPLMLLEVRLAAFLSANGHPISTDALNEFLKQKSKITFIFDGVDEVIKTSPWILDAITEAKKRYPASQTILSSRASGSYVKEIKCLSLTLLPFSDEQLLNFINGWFKADIEKFLEIQNHLNETPAIADIARSPLLATILCVLAENNIPLPNSELSMYSERLKLLFGHYDIHKRTKRISSHHLLLETVSRKIAYFLHNKNSRSASIPELQTAAIDVIRNYEAHEVANAVLELHDPCNVLVPMTEDGQFGFGHLRYQEYLTASEMCINRGIDLISKLSSIWWRPVLVFFAKMTDDVEHVIENVLDHLGKLGNTEETLRAMMQVRPNSEKKTFLKILELHSALDDQNDDLLDFHEYDVGSTEW